jgi:hypothetical protein
VQVFFCLSHKIFAIAVHLIRISIDSMPRKLLLKNFQSPGDIVMLTAAVRAIHDCCPGDFLTDVRQVGKTIADTHFLSE